MASRFTRAASSPASKETSGQTRMMDQTDSRKGDSSSPSERPAEGIQETTCCVVGAGPAGVMLSLLLARAGIPVTLLEAHRDFDRDFRGDTIHPSTLEVLDQIGLAKRLHELPHVKAPPFGPSHQQAALPHWR